MTNHSFQNAADLHRKVEVKQDEVPSHSETSQVAQAWCLAVSRMTPRELREHGEALLAVWGTLTGNSELDAFCDDDPTPAQCAHLAVKLSRTHVSRRKSRTTKLDRRVEWLSATFGLDDVEQAIILQLARQAAYEDWDNLMTALPGNRSSSSPRAIALLTGLNIVRIEDRVGAGGRLSYSGLINFDRDGDLYASALLKRIARSGSPPSRLAGQLVAVAPRSTLDWADYDHIGPARDIALRLVTDDRPAAILLYGPPGTGKSEFARLLADRAGKRAVFAGLEDDHGGEPDRRERLAHLLVLRSLTRGDVSKLLVMDEADDVLELGHSSGRAGRSKLFLNRLIEEDERSTIWIVNEPGMLEESFVRRMTLAIEFPAPPLGVRRRVVQRQAKAAKLVLADNEINRLALLPAAPAVIANSIKGAGFTKGGAVDAMTIAEGLVTALQGRPATAVSLPPVYDPALALADTDLELLAQRLVHAPERCWSLLLTGPSGTGKSAYARHLAERMGIELLVKRGSDLLGMYVGQTEAQIACAFRDAARSGALLLIDEADDFLFDRRDASRSWERSMVNEMLRQMELLQAPFVATTNFLDQLDPATQRRFSMRISFRALDNVRAQRLFRDWFGADAPTGSTLAGVTPGDYAVIAQRAKLLGEVDARVLARWLIEESEARGHNVSAIGF
jgi:MoxR-like ATPase